LITLPNDDDIINLSESFVELFILYCIEFVFFIPASVLDTNDGYAELPLSIILETVSNPSSIALPPIAISFDKSLPKLIASIVSSLWSDVAKFGYL
jgi:hypothetical protein